MHVAPGRRRPRFDKRTSLCEAQGDEGNEVDLKHTNIIIGRVMKLLRESMEAYCTNPPIPRARNASGAPVAT